MLPRQHHAHHLDLRFWHCSTLTECRACLGLRYVYLLLGAIIASDVMALLSEPFIAMTGLDPVPRSSAVVSTALHGPYR